MGLADATATTGSQGGVGKSQVRYSSKMDIFKTLADLRAERTQIEETIILLERLASGRGKRRGRPPLWKAAISETKRRGRPPGSKSSPKREPHA